MRPKYPMVVVAGLGGFFTVINLASAQNWTPTSAPLEDWGAVASSADGTKLVATGGQLCGFFSGAPVPIYTSTDSGATWTATSAPSNIWTSVASSADGTKLVAVAGGRGSIPGGSIYTSPDSGATWTQASAPSNYWASVASSADGTKLVAVGQTYDDINTGHYIGGPIYTSPDSGATWTQAGAPSNSWSSVASSTDGTKLVAVGQTSDVNTGEFVGGPGPIYTSADSGATWTQTSAPSTNWTSVASSADGTKLVAVVGRTYDKFSEYIDGPIYTSANSGATWTQTSAPSLPWHVVTSSVEGTILVAGAYDRDLGTFGQAFRIYTSADSGATWSASLLMQNWAAIACSADGYKLVAASSSGGSPRGLIYTSPYSGPWRLASAPTTNCTAVASSADGTKLVIGAGTYDINIFPLPTEYIAGPIYTSLDSGTSWTATSAPVEPWSAVASSKDGTKLVAVAITGRIYTSADSGATWTQTTAPPEIWASVACSADGTNLVAVSLYSLPNYDGGLIYTSADSGATWTQTSAPTELWASVACSADGTNLVAVSLNSSKFDGGLIYTSTDSGVTWKKRATGETDYWSSVASSADGTKLVAVPDFGPIHTSTDSGATWTQTSAPSLPWKAVTSSADGSKLVAVLYRGPIYTSSDSGATWTQANAPGVNWEDVASSADGGKLVAVASGGAIYTLQFPPSSPPLPPSPRLSIIPSGLSLGLSWLVPSTSFGLEQSFDLGSTNWTDVPTAPTLDFTNLHYQVTVSPSLGSRFYRLKQQQ